MVELTKLGHAGCIKFYGFAGKVWQTTNDSFDSSVTFYECTVNNDSFFGTTYGLKKNGETLVIHSIKGVN